MAITLAKSGNSHAISLKKGAAEPDIHVNLKWEGKKPSGDGMFGLGKLLGLGGAGANQDLDLGCMYEQVSGAPGVIQALGKSFGSKTAAPYIYLDGDDRSGDSAGGENLYILRPKLLKRVVVFAYFYEGSNDFRSVNATVTLKVEGGEEIIIHLNNPVASRKFCGLVSITTEGDKVVVTKEEKYFGGHQECDRGFGFGFNWEPGKK